MYYKIERTLVFCMSGVKVFCSTQTQHFYSYIMARARYIPRRRWWY